MVLGQREGEDQNCDGYLTRRFPGRRFRARLDFTSETAFSPARGFAGFASGNLGPVVCSNVVRIRRAFGNDHDRESNFAVALDVVYQRFHTGDDQAAFAGACDLASPAQSIFQVALGTYVDPSLSWHGKTCVPHSYTETAGRSCRKYPKKWKILY
jgi:hypothetical protein